MSAARRETWIWMGLGLGSALAFAALALVRRLNFDEPLALRAGWLALEGVDGRPAFVMPWTLLLGAIGQAVADPGLVLRLGRALALLTLGASGWLAARGLGLGRAGRGLATTLSVCQATFLVHGLEFRYDTAILGGLLAGLGLALGSSAGAAVGLGALIGWVGLHHLKGAFFAGVLLLAALLARGRSLRLGRVALGLGLALGAWALVLAVSGLGPAWARSWQEFVTLAGSERTNPAGALPDALLRDLGWWALAAAGVAASLWKRPIAAEDRALLTLGLASLGFPALHPHPWAYMLALPAPFLALLLARRHAELAPGRGRALAFAGAALALLAQVATGGSLFQQLRRGLHSDLDDTVAVTRAARATLSPEDAVLDPAGLLWFVRPCARDWYLDTLFAEGVTTGTWMGELAEGVPARCTVVVRTYRLKMLPEAAEAAIVADFEAAGPLALRPGDPRREALLALPRFADRELDSYK